MVQKFMGRIQWTKTIDQIYYYSGYYHVKLNKYIVKTGTSLRIWENIPYGWFQWYFRYFLGVKSSDEFRKINRWEKILVSLKVN